ncbi:MAG: hypothetical protein WCK55_03515 [Verrucomicrobiota bacterium]|nr:hypothetical protein [Verrucomicrobiota bacterium]
MDSVELARRAKKIAADARSLGRRAMENPVAAVLTAVAAGFVFGLALRLFERAPRGRGEK